MTQRWILHALCLGGSLLATWPAQAHSPSGAVTVDKAAPARVEARFTDRHSDRSWLTLRELAEAALATHPLLRSARLQTQASVQDIQAAQWQHWPTVSVVMETDTGSATSLPSRVLRVDQTVWDAGRIRSRVSESETLSDITQLQEQLQRHELLLQLVNAWQLLVGSQARLQVAQDTLQRLQFYKEQMVRRVQAQASAQIDLELVEARVLQTQVELTSARTSVRIALRRLEEYTGLPNLSARADDIPAAPPLQATQALAQQQTQTDWAWVVEQSPTLVKARREHDLATTRLGTKKAEQYPQLYVRYDKPLWDATTAQHNKTATYFAGLRYTPGAGLSGLAEVQALTTRVQSQEVAIDAARRDLRQSIQSDLEEFSTARERITAIENSVQGSALVLESYLRQFQANRKSWLDVLNSARELAQNQYSLADVHASMLGAMHRLQVRMGQTPALP